MTKKSNEESPYDMHSLGTLFLIVGPILILYSLIAGIGDNVVCFFFGLVFAVMGYAWVTDKPF